MTLALRAAGTPTAASAAVTAINPAVPAGWQSGDLSLMEVGARDSTIGFPSLVKSGTDPGDGWTKLVEFTGGAGAFGVDTGTGKTAFYYRFDSPVAPGDIPFTSVPANAAACAVIHIYSKDPAKVWDLSVSTSVSDNTQSSNYDANVGGTNPQIAVGDLLAFIRLFSADGGTITGEAIAVPGCTMGTLNIRAERTVQTGNDLRLGTGDIAPSSGTSTGAPTHSYNNLQGGTGHSAFLRLRESTPAPPPSGSGALTATAALGGSGSTVRSGSGSLAATASLSGAGAASRSGSGSLAATAALGGSGSVVRSGSGALAAAVALAGAGSTLRSGSGSISAVVVLSGSGGPPTLPPSIGSGSISATVVLAGAGAAPRGGTGHLSAIVALTGAGTNVPRRDITVSAAAPTRPTAGPPGESGRTVGADRPRRRIEPL